MLGAAATALSGKRISPAVIDDWLEEHPIERSDAVADHDQCLQAIMALVRRVESKHGQGVNRSVAELVQIVRRPSSDDYVSDRAAFAELMRLGIRVELDGTVIIANRSPELARALERTRFGTWRQYLLRIPGAERCSVAKRFAFGVSKAVVVPIDPSDG